jgi:xylulokinase
MGVMLAATDCLNWLAAAVGQSPADLANAVPDRIAGPQSTIFLPYLSGERTPHNDATIRGAFLGLGISTDQQGLTRAVMEGVTFGLRDSFEALRATGAELRHIMAVGGGARSEFWLSTLATVLNRPLHIPADGEFGAAMGAVRLAICAAENAKPDDIMVVPEVQKTIEPRTDLIDAYSERYEQFRAAYPAIREVM